MRGYNETTILFFDRLHPSAKPYRPEPEFPAITIGFATSWKSLGVLKIASSSYTEVNSQSEPIWHGVCSVHV